MRALFGSIRPFSILENKPAALPFPSFPAIEKDAERDKGLCADKFKVYGMIRLKEYRKPDPPDFGDPNEFDVFIVGFAF